jgi:hypothetical protein
MARTPIPDQGLAAHATFYRAAARHRSAARRSARDVNPSASSVPTAEWRRLASGIATVVAGVSPASVGARTMSMSTWPAMHSTWVRRCVGRPIALAHRIAGNRGSGRSISIPRRPCGSLRERTIPPRPRRRSPIRSEPSPVDSSVCTSGMLLSSSGTLQCATQQRRLKSPWINRGALRLRAGRPSSSRRFANISRR